MRHVTRAFLTGAVIALTATYANAQPPKLSRDWRTITAGELRVVGNASEKDLRRVLSEISAFRATLKAYLPGVDLSSPLPTTIVVFRDRSSFAPFVPRDGRGRKQENVGGYFAMRPDGNVLVLPLDTDRSAALQTIFHEYTHFVISRNYHDAPRWLHEGIAEFYSTFEVRSDGRGIIGKVPKHLLSYLRSATYTPSIGPLLTGDAARRLFEDPDKTAMFYAQSWIFVHFMTLSDRGARHGQISAFLDLLRQDKSAVVAAREAFGMDVNKLDNEISLYSRQFTFPALLIERSSDALDAAPAAQLPEADVAALKGRLLVDAGADREAEKFAAEALASQPTHIDARMVQARAELEQENIEAAVGQLTTIAAEHPDSYAAHYFLGGALTEAGRHTDAVAAFTRATALTPRSHDAWFGLSLAQLAAGLRAESSASLKRADQLYSTADWLYGRTLEALVWHRDDDALDSARAFVDRAGTGDPSAPYAAFAAVIAARRLGQPDAGAALLQRVSPSVPPKSWPATVAQYLAGSLDDKAFLGKAKDDGQRTEAHAYIGLLAAQSGNLDLARQHLLWVKDKGDRHYTEHRLARKELERLEKK
jgi:tetratricopeptide (TPR) repeat protein